MRARLSLLWVAQFTNLNIEFREILLKDKPSAMLLASPKATVPVLVLADGSVIDESRDIMSWALNVDDSKHLQTSLAQQLSLIDNNDLKFKHWLDRYKYSVAYPEHSQEYYRAQAEEFLAELERRLGLNEFLFADEPRVADLAIFPFVRQFAYVDEQWFFSADYPCVQRWLKAWQAHPLFEKAMLKYDCWQEGDKPLVWP